MLGIMIKNWCQSNSQWIENEMQYIKNLFSVRAMKKLYIWTLHLRCFRPFMSALMQFSLSNWKDLCWFCLLEIFPRIHQNHMCAHLKSFLSSKKQGLNRNFNDWTISFFRDQRNFIVYFTFNLHKTQKNSFKNNLWILNLFSLLSIVLPKVGSYETDICS